MVAQLLRRKRRRTEHGVHPVVEAVHQHAIDAVIQPRGVDAHVVEGILRLDMERCDDRPMKTTSFFESGERQPERQLEVDDVDLGEDSRQNRAVWPRHDEAHLAHRAKGQVQGGQDVVPVRRDRDHVVVAPKPVNDVLARKDPAPGVRVKTVRDERNPETRIGAHNVRIPRKPRARACERTVGPPGIQKDRGAGPDPGKKRRRPRP